MPPSRRKLFEELGVLNQADFHNPIDNLGISQELAHTLLTEDPTGGALQTVAGGMYRILSRRYHPDNGDTADRARFDDINQADRMITDASRAALGRWATADRPKVSAQQSRLKAQLDELMESSANLLQEGMELGHHPHHFSQMGWSQGLLARRAGSTLLLRQGIAGGTQVLRGQIREASPVTVTTSASKSQAFDFGGFLLDNDSFGIAPGEKLVTFIDETGRGSILAEDLTFMMDISDPIAAYRARREHITSTDINNIWGTDSWARTVDPVLFTTTVPHKTTRRRNIKVEFMQFLGSQEAEKGYMNLAWKIPMEVAGSISDSTFFRRIQHAQNVGANAIASSATRQQLNYFKLFATPSRQIFEHKAGYTPLLSAGNVLVLMDTTTKSPVVTDTSIIGLLGSNAKAP